MGPVSAHTITPKSGDAIAHIPKPFLSSIRKLLKEYKNTGVVAVDSTFSSRPTVADIVDTSRLSKDLQQLFAATKVYNRLGKGAEYSPRSSSITVGEMKSQELFSTLVHEMTHGSQYLYDLPLGDPLHSLKNYPDIKNAAAIINTRLEKIAIARSARLFSWQECILPRNSHFSCGFDE